MCIRDSDYTFNQHNSAGLWNITYLKYVNETLTETINGSVFIEQDIHDQQPVEEEDEVVSASKYSTNQIIAMAIAAISLMAIFVILFMNEESQE